MTDKPPPRWPSYEEMVAFADECTERSFRDAWDATGTAIFGSSEPDVRPLVAMLRGNAPIPPGIRDMLAELLDPDVHDYCDFKLELRDVSTTKKGLAVEFDNLIIAVDYERRLASGQKGEDAAQEIAENRGVPGLVEKKSLSARTVFNYLGARADRFNWLKGGK